MTTFTISNKQKYKHLTFNQIEYIVNMVIQFNAANTYRKRTGSRTEFMKSLAKEVGTSLSNVYNIVSDATITVRDSLLRERTELPAIAA